MSTSAVILAAGSATRLPNKVVLPLKGGYILVESAIQFALAAGVDSDDLVIVCRPDSPLRRILESRGWDFRCVYQPEPLGVTDAISRGSHCVDTDPLILFGDNLYDLKAGELLQTRSVLMHASTSITDMPELDGWGGTAWVSRESAPRHKFLGWIAPPLEAARKASGGLLQWMNGTNLRPFGQDVARDLGTEMAYDLYWAED